LHKELPRRGRIYAALEISFRRVEVSVEDKMLTCKDCANEFVFSSREQQFFAEKGFQNQPLRCRDCRQTRRSQGDGGAAAGSSRPSFSAVCAECNAETTVPFRPRGDRPVYCRTCFSARVPAGV
jgi:CxxC-x17-CxxC domain-containing protein